MTRLLRLHSSKSLAPGPSRSSVTHRKELDDPESPGQSLNHGQIVAPVAPTPSPPVSDTTSAPQNSPIGGDYSKIGRRRHASLVISSAPSTKWELLQYIRRLLFFTPPAPFSRLLSIHGRYRPLQSVESYNLLLIFSVRHSFSRLTRYLLGSMASNRIEPDQVTEKLVVRYLVSSGQWKTAWQQVMTRYSSVANTPLPALLELLAPGTRNFPRLPSTHVNQLSRHRPQYLYGQQAPNSPADDRLSRVKIPVDTLVLILNRFPTLSVDELARLPSRVVSYAVRGLIRNGHDAPAILLTKNHLKSLPSILSPAQAEFSQDLVHLHLTTGAIKLANYKKRRRLVEELLSIHPSLRPNAKTVFLLMRYMARSHRCGIEAYLFYKHYHTLWGPTVDSMENRRRIMQYALKQRKLGIVKEIYRWPPVPTEPPQTKIYKPFRVRPWRYIYPRKGKRKRYWKSVLIRYLGRRRARKRRISTFQWPEPSTKELEC